MSTLELLLQHGANPNAMTLSHVEEDKVTPGYLAATLTEAGADLTISRALHIAAEHCHTTVVDILYHLPHPNIIFKSIAWLIYTNCQLPIDQTDIRGETPLHWASRQGHLEVASFLIERCGCNFNSYIPRGHKRLLEYYKKREEE
ncbi:uncharacterized protein BX663DRAFT_518963 [Cokeromyces recurvatus]|uniref:uncharacterized protein n=1 Tax=Cokeromyces recurvatus TaxID=90255 RepID=UPI00221EBF2A|nr:uncharacterized protein BX663DRAFT_518963 [Cokeromyces recurvatus]KAI7900214.1 hypothetical protein BX663DRAFT_518963 [Cokeromyces recurvatus]